MAPKKQPWFRVYTETFTDSKIRRLTPAQRWLWISVLGAARSSPLAGHLVLIRNRIGFVPLQVTDLADFAGMRVTDVRTGLVALTDLGLIEHDETTGCLRVCRWNDRQYESDDVTARTAKHRGRNDDGTFHHRPMERSMDVPGNNDGTHQKTETETDTPTSQPPVEPRSHDQPGGGNPIIEEAAALLAHQETTRRGTEIGNPAGYQRTRTATIRQQHATTWTRHLEEHPDLTAQQLIDTLNAPPTPTLTPPDLYQPEPIPNTLEPPANADHARRLRNQIRGA